MQIRPCPQEHLEQWDVAVFLCHCVSIHATVPNPTYHCTLCVHAGPDDLDVDRRPPVVGSTRCLSAQMIIQALGISNGQNFWKSRFSVRRTCGYQESTVSRSGCPLNNTEFGIGQFFKKSGGSTQPSAKASDMI